MREMAEPTGSAAAVRSGNSGRRRFLQLGGMLGGAAIAAACGRITTPAGSFGISATPGAGAVPLSAPAAPQAFLYLTINSPAGTARKGYPAYVPSYFTVPANALVQVQLTCFDSGPAPVPQGYQNVQGTVGTTMDLLAATVGDLSKVPAQTVSGLPANGVVHTFTVPSLQLNVPVPGTATVRFLLQTGAAGTHPWQCMAACGSGTSGWGGPMAAPGYMSGALTVV
jgi:hypothetical protein